MLTVVGLSGSPLKPSKTSDFVETVTSRIASEVPAQKALIELSELVPYLGVRSRADAAPQVEDALQRIERADLLIVGSPVYKGSYTGLFKHLVDLIEYRALLGKPVGLLATGGSDRHALVIEHQLRPLFAFFGAKTLATGVFVPDRALIDGWVEDAVTRDRLAQLMNEAVHELRPSSQGRKPFPNFLAANANVVD